MSETMPETAMRRFDRRARQAHAESVARGEHGGQCEYLAVAGFYICNCHVRARLARGLIEPPALEWQYPICLGCDQTVDSDGDTLYCERCGTSWDSRGRNAHFHDDHGDLQAELTKLTKQRAVRHG